MEMTKQMITKECCHTGADLCDTNFGYTLSLSNTLKEMESDSLIIRNEYPQIPPKVEYSLSERGKSLIPILVSMCTWGEQHRNDDSE